jgi:cytoplasmic iron level regulating protein YaaA (DUF328/UPF0246 family)
VKFKVPVVTPEFKDYKMASSKLLVLQKSPWHDGAIYHRYECRTIEDLKGFNYDGYQFDATESKEIT